MIRWILFLALTAFAGDSANNGGGEGELNIVSAWIQSGRVIEQCLQQKTCSGEDASTLAAMRAWLKTPANPKTLVFVESKEKPGLFVDKLSSAPALFAFEKATILVNRDLAQKEVLGKMTFMSLAEAEARWVRWLSRLFHTPELAWEESLGNRVADLVKRNVTEVAASLGEYSPVRAQLFENESDSLFGWILLDDTQAMDVEPLVKKVSPCEALGLSTVGIALDSQRFRIGRRNSLLARPTYRCGGAGAERVFTGTLGVNFSTRLEAEIFVIVPESLGIDLWDLQELL